MVADYPVQVAALKDCLQSKGVPWAWFSSCDTWRSPGLISRDLFSRDWFDISIDNLDGLRDDMHIPGVRSCRRSPRLSVSTISKES